MKQSDFNINSARAKILVVDDTIDSLRLMANMLTDQGYNVRKVLNGQMALTAAQSAPPDLILLDINMPQLNGYEVCQQLKNNPITAEIPVIFISALDEVLDKVKAFSVGAVDYITKPFYFEELVTRVETQLKLRFLQKEISNKNQETSKIQDQYHRLLKHIKEGFFQVSLEGKFKKINFSLAQLCGYESIDFFLNAFDNSIYNLYSDLDY
ncbi:response regulator [Gloeothece verrucosa]|uniref:Response regulator receiver protein n=1 Tax=Gloeothece verrucosa (strain PCC 7822) TaxID=497965 RepID=E0UL26_GLOV7|nr:response regulator [Gloeothece verrucosa]ADN17656.1 response regulator receiver protein [Gloeothece verrucosa PCC 7822]